MWRVAWCKRPPVRRFVPNRNHCYRNLLTSNLVLNLLYNKINQNRQTKLIVNKPHVKHPTPSTCGQMLVYFCGFNSIDWSLISNSGKSCPGDDKQNHKGSGGISRLALGVRPFKIALCHEPRNEYSPIAAIFQQNRLNNHSCNRKSRPIRCLTVIGIANASCKVLTHRQPALWFPHQASPKAPPIALYRRDSYY